MRVITGTAKGHRLKAPRGMGTRPMLDRVKESLFSVLAGYDALHGRVLDLYAGTGSLGIECLSRGATFADFVEQNANVCRIIRENLEHTHLIERAQVHCMPVERFVRVAAPDVQYTLIVMDPPYADPVIERTIEQVIGRTISTPDGLLVVGHSPRVPLADSYLHWQRCKFRRLGDSCFSIYQPAHGEQIEGLVDDRTLSGQL